MAATKIGQEAFDNLAKEVVAIILADKSMKPPPGYYEFGAHGWVEGLCYIDLERIDGVADLGVSVDHNAGKAPTKKQRAMLRDLLVKILEAMEAAKVEPNVWVEFDQIAVTQTSPTAEAIVSAIAKEVRLYVQ